jgi:HrpA-like RNA helicase
MASSIETAELLMDALDKNVNPDIPKLLKSLRSLEQVTKDAYKFIGYEDDAIKTWGYTKKRKPVKIRYDASTMRAVVSASFKDLFGFDENSLIICNGKIKPTFEILAPNSRPVQTTQNLQNFWSTSWINIRKELKARYPKHFPPTAPY